MLRSKKVKCTPKEIGEIIRHHAYDLRFDILSITHSKRNGEYVIDMDTDGYPSNTRPVIPAIVEA